LIHFYKSYYSYLLLLEMETVASIPGPCPYLTRPTLLSNGKVRDLSLTDYSGSYLLVFFYREDFSQESREDVLQLNSRAKQLRKAGCDLLAVSSDSAMVHSEWVEDMRSDSSLVKGLDVPLVSDKGGDLSSALGVWMEDEGTCLRSVLVVDDKSVMRHLAVSSLPMDDLVDHCLDTVAGLKKDKLDQVKGGSKPKGLLDRLWRKNIRPADSPRKSLVRSTSFKEKGSQKEDRGRSEKKETIKTERPRSRSGSKTLAGGKLSLVTTSNLGQERANLFTDSVISSLRELLKSGGKEEVSLPEYSSGEVTLSGGRVAGLSKVARGTGSIPSLGARTDVLLLNLPLMVRGLQASYKFGGRRVEGELTCNYDRVEFSVKLSQKVKAEVGGSRPELVLLQLAKVEGVRMDVTGFGPLNWIAGKKVSDLVQEVVLQEVEDELRYQLEVLLQNLGFYFQIEESVSPSLTPIGIIAF